MTEWREIGVLAASGEAELDVGLQVPTDLDNNYQELVGYLDWEFMVEEIDDGKVQTGDNANDLPWICGLGVSILAITVVVVKGGKDKKEKRDETE